MQKSLKAELDCAAHNPHLRLHWMELSGKLKQRKDQVGALMTVLWVSGCKL